MNFADLMPAEVFTGTLGDDVIYHAKTGAVTIKAMVTENLEQIFSGDSYLPEKRWQVDVAVADAPGLKKDMKFTINGKKYVVDAVIRDDGVFATCLVR